MRLRCGSLGELDLHSFWTLRDVVAPVDHRALASGRLKLAYDGDVQGGFAAEGDTPGLHIRQGARCLRLWVLKKAA